MQCGSLSSLIIGAPAYSREMVRSEQTYLSQGLNLLMLNMGDRWASKRRLGAKSRLKETLW